MKIDKNTQWKWEKWFAWHPVRTVWGNYAWFRTIARKREWYSDEKNPSVAYLGWEYDEISNIGELQ